MKFLDLISLLIIHIYNLFVNQDYLIKNKLLMNRTVLYQIIYKRNKKLSLMPIFI
jgi:hypothetical protein